MVIFPPEGQRLRTKLIQPLKLWEQLSVVSSLVHVKRTKRHIMPAIIGPVSGFCVIPTSSEFSSQHYPHWACLTQSLKKLSPLWDRWQRESPRTLKLYSEQRVERTLDRLNPTGLQVCAATGLSEAGDQVTVSGLEVPDGGTQCAWQINFVLCSVIINGIG